MRVAVIQSSYIPWRGYFDFIRSVDLFVIYDDVQYSKGSWRNRNRLKTRQGLKWLTVPVTVSLGQRICDVCVSAGALSWGEKQRAQLRDSLGSAPYFDDAVALWDECIAHRDHLLSRLNVRLLREICGYLGIQTEFAFSSDFALRGESTQRLVDLLIKVGATSYLSGPSADDYLDRLMFAEKGIRLEYKSYDYGVYPQLWGGFEGAVTILDLIANCGRKSVQHILSRVPDTVIVP